MSRLQAKEVIDLLDSDVECDKYADKTYHDDEEVLLLGTIQPPKTVPAETWRAASGERKKCHDGNNGEGSSSSNRSSAKRPRKGLLKKDTASDDDAELTAENVIRINGDLANTAARIVRIDNDGMDNAVVTPGVLKPMNSWIHSGNTCDIVQLVCQKDKWSCGFRNSQMMLSAVLPHLPADHAFFQKFPHRKDHVSLPSLRQIQRAFEEAWRAGFDPRGADHFQKAMVGKRSWIGAVEVSSIMSYWGVDSAVIQFIRCRESREQLPGFVRAYFSKSLGKEACPFCTCGHKSSDSSGSGQVAGAMQCAQQLLHFSSISCSSSRDGFQIEGECQCPVLPLYLQWQGHSVTIVGMDDNNRQQQGGEFLVFDPLKQQQVPSRLPVGKVISKDIQVVMVTSFRSLSMKEQQLRKGANESTFVATAAQEAVQRTMMHQSIRS